MAQDASALSVGKLKALLKKAQIDSTRCIEKSELVKLVNDHRLLETEEEQMSSSAASAAASAESRGMSSDEIPTRPARANTATVRRLPSKFSSSEDVVLRVIQGWLKIKKTRNMRASTFMHRWHKRWFLLNPKTFILSYYKKKGHAADDASSADLPWKALGVVPLDTITLVVADDASLGSGKAEFKVQVTTGHVYTFRAPSVAETKRWVAHIRNYCIKLRKREEEIFHFNEDGGVSRRRESDKDQNVGKIIEHTRKDSSKAKKLPSGARPPSSSPPPLPPPGLPLRKSEEKIEKVKSKDEEAAEANAKDEKPMPAEDKNVSSSPLPTAEGGVRKRSSSEGLFGRAPRGVAFQDAHRSTRSRSQSIDSPVAREKRSVKYYRLGAMGRFLSAFRPPRLQVPLRYARAICVVHAVSLADECR